MKYLIISLSFFLLACEGFKFNARMCERLQPADMSSECINYNEDEARKASLPMYDTKGECLPCSKPEKIEVNQ